jgi:hypothetical protein
MPAKKLQKKQDPEYLDEFGTIIEWSAPGRPFKKRTKQYFLTAILIMLLVEIILFLFSQYILMVVVVSLVFVGFSLELIPPKDFNYRISTEGIQVEDKFFLWQELYDFYFRKSDDTETLHIRTQAYIPGELIITLGPVSKNDIRLALLPFLPYREYVKPTFIDKASSWLSRNFPLENK